jgi:hypothetical protein
LFFHFQIRKKKQKNKLDILKKNGEVDDEQRRKRKENRQVKICTIALIHQVTCTQ